MNKNTGIIAGFLLAGFLVLSLSLSGGQNVSASAPSGLPSIVATSSVSAVSRTAISLFATSSCSARIITTAADPIMLTFSDYAAQTPSATYGHFQGASTTVAYDSGLYGCGLVKAYSFNGQDITLTETR
jgi:hypothetical protein